jgi:hypothetical protein
MEVFTVPAGTYDRTKIKWGEMGVGGGGISDSGRGCGEPNARREQAEGGQEIARRIRRRLGLDGVVWRVRRRLGVDGIDF